MHGPCHCHSDPGLEITAGQRTMSGLIKDLTGFRLAGHVGRSHLMILK